MDRTHRRNEREPKAQGTIELEPVTIYGESSNLDEQDFAERSGSEPELFSATPYQLGSNGFNVYNQGAPVLDNSVAGSNGIYADYLFATPLIVIGDPDSTDQNSAYLGPQNQTLPEAESVSEDEDVEFTQPSYPGAISDQQQTTEKAVPQDGKDDVDIKAGVNKSEEKDTEPPGEDEASQEEITFEPVIIKADKESNGAPTAPRGPGASVNAWRSQVSQRTRAIPQRTMPNSSAAGTQVRQASTTATAPRRAERARIPEEAARNVSVPPMPREPLPAPPASDPVPTHTRAIINASDQRLPDAYLPRLRRTPVREIADGRSIGGNQPQLGQTPVPSNIFQLLITPNAEQIAQIPENERDNERQQLERSRNALTAEVEAEHVFGDGAAVPLRDRGPTQPTALASELSTPIAQVVTRLLADIGSATSNVLTRLRTLAYPRGLLGTLYPDIGSSLKGQIKPRMTTELRLIADSAGVAGAELDRMVGERRTELDGHVSSINTDIETAGEEAGNEISDAGQENLNLIEGARQATDQEIISRQEEASGGNDPAVINARRDLIIRWARNHVTTQTTDYQKAGEKRERDLTQAQRERTNAYNATAQREEYRIFHPRAPYTAPDRTDESAERGLQDIAALIRTWTRERVEGVQTSIRASKRTASTATRENRSAIETVGTSAIEAARQWAEDRILEGESWWTRFKARISRWFSESQDINEQWSVRRTEETRDGITRDLTAISVLQTQAENGTTQESLLENQGLTTDQRDIINEFFNRPRGTNPLDIAAGALRQRLARQYLTVARPIFESELMSKPAADHAKLTQLARALRPGFDGAQIAQDIHAQLDSFDSDEAAMIRSLEGLSAFEGAIVRKVYLIRYEIDLDRHMRQAFDSDEMDQAQLQLSGRQAAADAARLNDAMGIISTDEDAIMDLLRGRSQEEIEAIRREYRTRYGEGLDHALNNDLDRGNEQDQASALLRGDRETADAIAIDEAMRGGTGWGTDEEDIEKTYKRVRDEVLAQAQRERWNAAQMEAEVRRRTQRIEARFNQRYANVEEYNQPGLSGRTVLSRAISSEMDPGPERNLANALSQNNLAAADAARIEIERRSVYASDDAINNVLKNQYERSLQATRLDQGPARQMRVDRLRRQLEASDEPMSEDAISRRVMALEREMEQETESEAQRRSNISMEALTQAYDDSYTFPLWYTIETNMSGTDREQARNLHAQGGRLTALQEVEYATRGAGTDEEALRNRIGNMTLAEIAALRQSWERAHPGESFNNMLRSELSGRDESDIMDMVYHGAPKSASERIAQEERRTQRELDDLTGILGGVAAGSEARWLEGQRDELRDLRPLLLRANLSREERAQLRSDLDFRVERVQQAVKDHRRALDSVTNTATQIAGLAVAVTVGAALTFLSGGALGPVMIAVIASVAATLTTMGTKALIQGGAYGGEDIGIDIAVGVVDALTAAATAGMGGQILRGASGTAQRAAQPTRLTQMLGNASRSGIAQRVGRTRIGQAIGRGASRANQAQSGFLVSGIRGQNPLARMASGDNRAMRLLATGLADGIENAVSALPSSFTQTALDENTYEGNPFLNMLQGTAMGVGTSVVMGGVMQGATGAFGHLRSNMRLATQSGRHAEANRLLGGAFQQHRANNPDASYQQFLAHPDGQRATMDVQSRGLLEVDQPVSRTNDGDSPVPPTQDGAAPRPAEAPARRADMTPADAGDLRPAPEALTSALPPRLAEAADVRVNPDMGGSVRVMPDSGGIFGGRVRVEVGPDARPIDIMMHANTVQSMQRYSGLLGRLRALNDWFNLTTVGSSGWEAKLELEKLPGIIHERMQRLANGDLDASQRARLIDEINGLNRQIDGYQRVLESPVLRDTEGRGHVAAEVDTVPGVSEVIPSRARSEMPGLERTIVDDSPMAGTVYQIGHRWQENGRVYRRVLALDPEGRIRRVREEILMNPRPGSSATFWQQRGSWSSGHRGVGAVGEAASQISIREGLLPKAARGESLANIDPALLRNGSDNGFDGAFIKFDSDGAATVVVVEAKNQPSGLSLNDFSAITQGRLSRNLDTLRNVLKSKTAAELNMTEAQRLAALDALDHETPRIEIQVHTAHGTRLGARDDARSSILQDIEAGALAETGMDIPVRHVPLRPSITRRARRQQMRQFMIGEPSARLQALSGSSATTTSRQQALSMLSAEGAFTTGTARRTGNGEFIDEAKQPFRVITPGAGGRSPRAADFAEDVVSALNRTSANENGKPWKVVVDLSNLTSARRRALLRALHDRLPTPDTTGLEARILLHERETGEVSVFQRDNIE